MARYSPTERIGVNKVENIVINDFSWIFREQPVIDMGIDAHIEYVENGSPSGKLLAVQIKTGKSHFNKTKEGYVYYGKNEHLEYWLNHSLPVLLIAYLPELDLALWAHISKKSIIKTKKGWKVTISHKNTFDVKSKTNISSLFSGTVIQQELRRFAIDKPMMKHIVSGGKVSVRLQDWVNKSLGRTPVQVFIYDEDGEETLSKEWYQYHLRYGPQDLTEALFPWATADLDKDFYDIESYGWAENDYRHKLLTNYTGEVFSYGDACGEVEYYQLQLHLNSLGKAYLVLDNHLETIASYIDK